MGIETWVHNLLIHIAYLDIFENDPEWFSEPFFRLAKENLYTITPKQVAKLPVVNVEDAVKYLRLSGVTNTENVIYLYLKNLSELWRRRFKFYNILKTQPFPFTEQIGPRCLLEYGNCEDDLLFSWMSWRKFIYDIDNRSALGASPYPIEILRLNVLMLTAIPPARGDK